MIMNKAYGENTIGRVYDSIKESVVCYECSPGDRLNIELLAEQLRVSTTPVRESLNRLVAEDLITMVPGIGFFMKSLLEPEIRDLYVFNQALLNWSLELLAASYSQGDKTDTHETSASINKLMQSEELSNHTLAGFTALLFSHLAKKTDNREVHVRMRNINDRLHFIRMSECELVDDSRDLILALFMLNRGGSYDELRDTLATYHTKRLDLLPKLIRDKSAGIRMAG